MSINEYAQKQIDDITNTVNHLKPLVVINCITYNHEPYIREALEGLVMQNTNFPFVAIVHDDASTDGTAAIVREYAEKYPDIIKPIYETENQYSKRDGSLGRIMQEARMATGAKYIAFCEGDDYWTDPLKLQKQVDYLESHPDCTIVCSNCDRYIQNKGLMIYNQCKENGIFTFNDLILHNFILTATVVVRAKLLYGEYNDFFKEWETQNFGDYQIWLYASSMGYIMRFSETMTVYRILDNSASHYTDSVSKLRWMQSEFYLFDYFDSRFNIPKSTRKEALFLRCSAWGSTAIKLNNKELIKRIGAFYRDNKFYIAWLSFVIMYKYPHINFISKFIESQERIKAPFRYLKSKWSMYKKSNINGYKY